MKQYIQEHRMIAGILLAVCAVFVAAVYSIFMPTEVYTASGASKIILSYGHSLVWLTMAVASVLWAFRKTKRLVEYLLCGALLVYVTFLITLWANG